MQGEDTEKATLPKQQQPYFLPPKQAHSTFPAPAGDTILIVTALGFHDLIMTVSAFHKQYICFFWQWTDSAFRTLKQMNPQLSPKLTMKAAHIWNPLANTHACIPRSLTSSFCKWKKTTLPSCQDSRFSMRSKPEPGSLTDPQTPTWKSNTWTQSWPH